MPASAHTALVVSIVASALGALVMCLLVARYGLTHSGGDDAGRGFLVTRFGHAFAGVCFAATGILSLVALVAPTREPRAAPTTIVKVEPDRGAEARLQALAAEVKAIATRLEKAEARMTQAETRMTVIDGAARRLGDEVGSVSAQAKQLERTIAALPRRMVVPEAAVKETKPAPAVKETPRAVERPATPPPAAIEVPPAPASPTPLPQMPEPVAAPRPTPDPVVTPRPRASEPVAASRPTPDPVATPRPRATEPVAARTPEPAASARVAPQSGRATIEAPARNGDGGAAMAKPGEPQLTEKLREDWKTIRGGLSTAGDDFKAAFRDLGRKLWR